MIKIIPTVGPATNDVTSLKFLSKYSDVFRLNASHNTISWHKSVVQKINNLKKNIKILIDIPGIKPRTNNIQDLNIKKGSLVLFYYQKKPNLKNLHTINIPLSNPIPQKNVSNKKNTLSLDDGKFFFKILNLKKNYILAFAEQTFILKTNKGLNIPNSIYDNNLQEKKYLSFLKKLNQIKFDAVGLSFIQNHNLILKLKKKYPEKLLVSKIENYEGIKNALSICKNSDVIMIDRGDLAAEIGNNNLFDAILKVSEICKSLNKPLMIATENLESMLNKKIPTKSEVFTLGYYRQINVDSIMLSEETALSDNWKDIINWIYKFYNSKENLNRNNVKYEETFWNLLSKDLKLPIVIFTKRGKSIHNLESLSYINEINVFTESNKIKTLCEFKKNINVFLTKKFDNKNLLKFIRENIKKNKKNIFKNSKQVIVIFISYPRKKTLANPMMLVNKKDF